MEIELLKDLGPAAIFVYLIMKEVRGILRDRGIGDRRTPKKEDRVEDIYEIVSKEDSEGVKMIYSRYLYTTELLKSLKRNQETILKILRKEI